MKTLSINGQSLSAYGIYISSDTYLNAPSIDYTEYQIPARDGSLFSYNKRLNDVVRKFTCYIPDGTDVTQAMKSLKTLLYSNIGDLKLESDYTPEYYQIGTFIDGIEAEPFNLGRIATFELYFSCRPYHYAKEETTTRLFLSQDNGGFFTYNSYPFLKQVMRKIPEPFRKTDGRYFVSYDMYTVPTNTVKISITDPDISTLGIPWFFALVIVKGEFPNFKFERLVTYCTNGESPTVSIPTKYKDGNYRMVAIVEYLPEYLTYVASVTWSIAETGGLVQNDSYVLEKQPIETDANEIRPILMYEIQINTPTDVHNAESTVTSEKACVMINFEKLKADNIDTFLINDIEDSDLIPTSHPETFKLYYDTETGEGYAKLKVGGGKVPMSKYFISYGDFKIHNGDILATVRTGQLLHYTTERVHMIYRGMFL